MKIDVSAGPLETMKSDAIVIGVYAEEAKLRDVPARVDRALGGQLREILDAERYARETFLTAPAQA